MSKPWLSWQLLLAEQAWWEGEQSRVTARRTSAMRAAWVTLARQHRAQLPALLHDERKAPAVSCDSYTSQLGEEDKCRREKGGILQQLIKSPRNLGYEWEQFSSAGNLYSEAYWVFLLAVTIISHREFQKNFLPCLYCINLFWLITEKSESTSRKKEVSHKVSILPELRTASLGSNMEFCLLP